MARIDTPEAAMHLARAISSDIALYNKQKVINGLKEDRLFEVLEEELNEGLELYRSRVSEALFSSTNFFHRAVIDEIIQPRGDVPSKIW